MKQVTHVHNIPLGRRIAEIMKEKGSAYSISAVSSRIGINRESLRLKLAGKRELYEFEIEKLATDLKITKARILMKDTEEKESLLFRTLKGLLDLDSCLELALEISKLSLGLTEKCHIMHKLGYIYFYLQRYDESDKALSEALELAQEIEEEYGDKELYFKVLKNYAATLAVKKDYARVIETIRKVEHVFNSDSNFLAGLNYIHAMMQESSGNIVEARKYAYQSLDHTLATGIDHLIGRAYVNVGHFDFILKEYERAKESFEVSLPYLESDPRSYLVAKKELAKCLIILGQDELAKQIVVEGLSVAEERNYIEQKAKLLILRTRVEGEVSYAQTVLESPEVPDSIRYLACKCIIQHFRNIDDAESLLKYYKVAENFAFSPSDIIHEEGL